MPWHVAVRLPDGRVACADFRDPIVKAMRKINEAVAQCRQPDPRLHVTVAAWLDGHREQSAVCHVGLSPSGLPCGHD